MFISRLNPSFGKVNNCNEGPSAVSACTYLRPAAPQTAPSFVENNPFPIEAAASRLPLPARHDSKDKMAGEPPK
jgi:hypothetical protein